MNSIEINKDRNWYWNNINETQFKTILSFQLVNNLKSYMGEKIYSYNNYDNIWVFNELKNNIKWNYILSIWGKKEWLFNDIKRHAVVPYKIEWNKIYIWDNNIPYPNVSTKDYNYLSYNQYIEILPDGSWYNQYYNTEFWWDYFDKLLLINVDNLYNTNNTAMWFNDDDKLYTLSWKSDLLLIDSLWRKTGFYNWNNYEEIPWTLLVINDNWVGNENNLWKQIYIPEKIDGLTININWKENENYDLLIAWWDYYTKISNVITSSWQTDIYKITRENIELNFDDTKTSTWTYSIMVDDFQNNGTWTIYTWEITNQIWIQTLGIDWEQVKTNWQEAITYTADINNDWEIDLEKTTSPIENPEEKNNKKSSISWTVNILENYLIQGQKNNIKNNKNLEKLKYLDIILMLEKQKDEKEDKKSKKNKKYKLNEILTKKQLIKIKEDWTFKLDDIDPWTYKLKIVDNKLHQVVSPESWYYELEIKDWYTYINRDFNIIKNYKLKDVRERKDKLDNLKHK